MRSKIIEQSKQKLKLSKIQREIIVGTLLGDAHLETQNDGKTYRLKIEHSQRQTSYVNWLFSNLSGWVLTKPKLKTKSRNGVESNNVCFQTLSHSSLRFYGQSFYDGKKKVIPKIINKLLTPLALAVWFMDDGSLKSKQHRALILNTQGFRKVDLALLQSTLKHKYSIEAQFRQQKDGTQLLIVEPSATKFAQVIEPYLLPEFYYKLGKIGLTRLPKM